MHFALCKILYLLYVPCVQLFNSTFECSFQLLRRRELSKHFKLIFASFSSLLISNKLSVHYTGAHYHQISIAQKSGDVNILTFAIELFNFIQ